MTPAWTSVGCSGLLDEHVVCEGVLWVTEVDLLHMKAELPGREADQDLGDEADGQGTGDEEDRSPGVPWWSDSRSNDGECVAWLLHIKHFRHLVLLNIFLVIIIFSVINL